MGEIKTEIKSKIIDNIRIKHKVTTKVIGGIIDHMQTKCEGSNQNYKPYLILIEEALINYTTQIEQIIEDQ